MMKLLASELLLASSPNTVKRASLGSTLTISKHPSTGALDKLAMHAEHVGDLVCGFVSPRLLRWCLQ